MSNWQAHELRIGTDDGGGFVLACTTRFGNCETKPSRCGEHQNELYIDGPKYSEQIYYNRLQENIEAHLPPTQFLFTLDQVAQLLSLDMKQLIRIVDFDNQRRTKGRMRAVNILPSELSHTKEYRIPYDELVAYMRKQRIVIYERRLRIRNPK